MFAAFPRATPVTRLVLAVLTVTALLVGGLPVASALPAQPATRVARQVDARSGPAWLITKNAMVTGPERTALIDLLHRQIERQQSGDIVRLTTWSFHSQRIADALIRAKKRGATVRVVVNRGTWKTAATRSLRRALGTSASNGSYIVAPYRQSMHTKVATFSRDRTVLISSANVSDPRQWNHSVVLQNSDLYRQTTAWADRLGAGDGMRYTRVQAPGVVLHFYPGTVDPVLNAIRNANGRRITIQMSIWKGTRGHRIADALIEAHRRGSPIAINTGEPWSDPVRKVAAAGIDVFDTLRATGGKAKAHDKLLIVGNDVYTGSTNWGNFPRRFFEVVAHINSPGLALQLREYVSRTREQARGAPIFPAPEPQPLKVAPTAGGLVATWSAAGAYDVNRVASFDVVAVRADAAERTVLARQSVRPVYRADGQVDPAAVLRATFSNLPGGTKVAVEVTPMGEEGPLDEARVLTATPYLLAPGTPTLLSVTPTTPHRATVSFAPAGRPHSPPLKAYQVAWSSDGGRSWKSRTATSTSLVIRGLPTDKRTLVKVREVPTVGTPSPYTRASRVTPTRRPHRPQDVTVQMRRTHVASVRWQDPHYSGAAPVKAWVVKYRVKNQTWKHRQITDRGKNRLVVRGLPKRGRLDVRVAAANKHGRSAFTPIASTGLRLR